MEAVKRVMWLTGRKGRWGSSLISVALRVLGKIYRSEGEGVSPIGIVIPHGLLPDMACSGEPCFGIMFKQKRSDGAVVSMSFKESMSLVHLFPFKAGHLP